MPGKTVNILLQKISFTAQRNSAVSADGYMSPSALWMVLGENFGVVN